jgi:hypothetical protein
MGRRIAYLTTAGLGLAAIGCGDSTRGSPTSPDFAPSVVSCDLSTARGLVNSIFPSAQRTPAKNLLQTIQNAGVPSDAATNAGFDLFALIAAYGTGTPQDRSTFVNAIIPCQSVGSVSLPIDFTSAFGPDGAFEVRGKLATDDAAVVSHDGVWGLEPPLDISADPAVRVTWNNLTTAVPPTVTTKRFLAYGMPVTVPGFTNEIPVSTIFDWFTIPKLNFKVPGVVVGTCFTGDPSTEYLIQHNPAGNGGEIVPSATPSFCSPTLSSYGENRGWSPKAVAHRLIDFFKPQPLLAAALGTRPPGGSIGSLSPSAAINPGQITLAFQGQVADGRTTPATVKFIGGNSVSVSVTPAGSPGKPPTPMDGVHVRLIATTNLGATVVASGNTATTEDGVATFPNLTISKAGGYRLIATLDGFGQNSTAGYTFNNVTSNGFNLKQTK